MSEQKSKGDLPVKSSGVWIGVIMFGLIILIVVIDMWKSKG